jgi:hypothetical protein
VLICIHSALHIVVCYINQQNFMKWWEHLASYYLHLAMQVKTKKKL